MLPQTKVFVGSLPQGSKPEELRKLFERFGEVTECDIMNRCGFVHMQTEEQAGAAIRALNNTTFNDAVISVERGRIKERGQRGPVGPGGPGGPRVLRGGPRGPGGDRRGGGPMRGPGGPRDGPYMRDSRPAGHMRGAPMGIPVRSTMGSYDRGMDRGGAQGGYDDRYNVYTGEDRRGFALMDRGPRPDHYASQHMYGDDRRYGGAVDDIPPMYPDDRHHHNMYPDERDMMDRRPSMRAGPMSMSSGYDRGVPRATGMGNGDMYSRRSPMRGAPAVGGYDRDPYAPQYAHMPRGGGGARGGREAGGGMGPRRY